MTEKQREIVIESCEAVGIVAGCAVVVMTVLCMIGAIDRLLETQTYWPLVSAGNALGLIAVCATVRIFTVAGRPEPPAQRDWAHELWDLADDVVTEYEGDGGSISRLAALVEEYDENA